MSFHIYPVELNLSVPPNMVRFDFTVRQLMGSESTCLSKFSTTKMTVSSSQRSLFGYFYSQLPRIWATGGRISKKTWTKRRSPKTAKFHMGIWNDRYPRPRLLCRLLIGLPPPVPHALRCANPWNISWPRAWEMTPSNGEYRNVGERRKLRLWIKVTPSAMWLGILVQRGHLTET